MTISTSPLRISQDECWCTRCGEVMFQGHCPACGSRSGVPAVRVLQPDEYFLAA